MKYLGWVLAGLVLVAFAASRRDPPKDGRLAIAQAHLAELLVDSAAHARYIKELEDSLEQRLAHAGRGQDEVRRRVPVDSSRAVLADSLSRAATTMAELRSAYDALRFVVDSQSRTIRIAQQAANDFGAALAFSRLQRVKDSVRIAQFEQAAPIVLAASKKSWWTNRIVVNVGYGASITDNVIRASPTATVGLRVWPWS